MLQSTAPVVLKVLLCTTKYYSVLQSTIPVLLCTTLYYSVLQSITPVLPRTRSTTPVLLCYYKVLLQYYSSTEKASKMIVSCEGSPNFTEKASKTSVSCEASDNFHRRRFQNDRFARGFLQISQKKLAFRAKLPTIFTEEGSKMIVSCEASSKFHKGRFQNERFARGCFKISQKKLPKRAFRAKLPTIFTEEGSKMIVSCEAASKFHRKSFQNERFVRSFSYNFHSRRFQNDRFVRSFRQFSRKKHPKGSFRAMLPTIFTEKTSKRIVSRDASDNFHRKNFQKDRKLKMEKNSPKKWKKIPRKVLDPKYFKPNHIHQVYWECDVQNHELSKDAILLGDEKMLLWMSFREPMKITTHHAMKNHHSVGT